MKIHFFVDSKIKLHEDATIEIKHGGISWFIITQDPEEFLQVF